MGNSALRRALFLIRRVLWRSLPESGVENRASGWPAAWNTCTVAAVAVIWYAAAGVTPARTSPGTGERTHQLAAARDN